MILDLNRYRRYRRVIENIVQEQLFYELFMAEKPDSPEEFQKRVKYLSSRINLELFRSDQRN